jgi:hypothetical protein
MNTPPRLHRGPLTGLLMALFSLVVGGVLAAISRSLFLWETRTTMESVVRTVSLGAFLTLTIFCVLAIVWSLFAPGWIERLVQRAFSAVLISVGLLLVITACLFIYFRMTR